MDFRHLQAPLEVEKEVGTQREELSDRWEVSCPALHLEFLGPLCFPLLGVLSVDQPRAVLEQGVTVHTLQTKSCASVDPKVSPTANSEAPGPGLILVPGSMSQLLLSLDS